MKMEITLTTSGPVIKRYDVSFTMKVKSVRAGEQTAPPAQGPIIIEIYKMRKKLAKVETIVRAM